MYKPHLNGETETIENYTKADDEKPFTEMHCIAMEDSSNDGVEEFSTKILCGIDKISQSNRSKFNKTQSIMVKESFPSTISHFSIANR